MKFKPHSYQQDMIDMIRKQNTFVIAQMGAGKTAATLEALTTAKGRILIIAPLRVAKYTWPDEIDKWENFDAMGYSVCVGPLKKRLEALNDNNDITIINRENVPWLVDHYGLEWPFKIVVIDESSSFKSQKSQRFKALKRVRKLIKRMVLLTGTPAPNTPMELWPQVFLLDGGMRLGTAFTRFRESYFVSDYFGYKWEPKPDAKDKILNKIKDLCVIVESYGGLPDRVDLTNKVYLSPDVMEEYQYFERHQLAEIGGSEVTATNAAVVVGKLAQMAGGAVYDDEQKWHSVHGEKISALEELLEACEGENVLVAYNYRHEADRIKATFKHAVDIKDDGVIEKWNKGQVSLMLAHPASAGHGLNLAAGGNRIIWFSPTWSNELKLQFDARLHRQGQTKPVFIHTLVADETIDEDIVDAVINKKRVQDIVIKKLK